MALEFICSDVIEYGKKIKIPEGATHYRIKSRKIRFFYYNERENYEIPRLNLLPLRTREISFNLEGNRFHVEYGKPIFYDINSIILKTDGEWFKYEERRKESKFKQA